MTRCAGMTLWELLVTLVVVGTVAGLGVPSFEALGSDSRQTADINAFVTAIQFARSEAAKRGRAVVLCNTVDLARCENGAIGYDVGWMVFVNEDGARPPQRSAVEPLLYRYEPASDGPIMSNRRLFEFRAFRKRSTNGTVTFCDRRGARAARALIVSYTGRPRVSTSGPGGRPLACST